MSANLRPYTEVENLVGTGTAAVSVHVARQDRKKAELATIEILSYCYLIDAGFQHLILELSHVLTSRAGTGAVLARQTDDKFTSPFPHVELCQRKLIRIRYQAFSPYPPAVRARADSSAEILKCLALVGMQGEDESKRGTRISRTNHGTRAWDSCPLLVPCNAER